MPGEKLLVTRHKVRKSKLSEIEYDPFSDAPEDTVVEPVKKTPAKKQAPRPEPTGEGKVTLTLKGGAGFDAPWIVIHAADIPDAYLQLSGDNAALLVELMEKVKKAGVHFAGQPSQPVRSTAPQGQQPPAGAPECPPGWTFKSGVSKAGKPYQGFFPPRGDESKPIFFN